MEPTDPSRFYPLHWPRGAQYAFALLLVASALLGRWALTLLLGDRVPFLLVFAALMVLVALVRPGPFLAAAALGGLGSLYLFFPPESSWRSDGLAEWVAIALFALAAVAAGLTAWLSGRAQDRLIEARAHAEKQREELRVTLASIGDAVITTDELGNVNFLNGVAENMTGWSLEGARGRPLPAVFNIINEQSRQPVESPVAKVLQLGKVVGLANHTLLIRKDGTERAIDDSAAPIRDRDGRLTGVVLVFHDITERRTAERVLVRSEGELADFFENASVGLHWVGPDGIILRANQAELDLLGYRSEEYVGHHIAEFHVDGPVIDNILACLSRGDTLQKVPARLRCKDSSIRDVLISSNVYFEEGKFVHTRCFTLDVTDLRRAERALIESEARYRAIGEAIDFGIWVCDTQGRNTYASDSFLRLTGLTQEQCSNFGWRDVLHPDEAEKTIAEWQHCVKTNGTWDREHRIKGVDGQWHAILARGVPFTDKDRGALGWAGINLDISRLKIVEGALRDADRRKNEFLAILAHELRNPLAPIRNALEIVKHKVGESDSVRTALGMIERQLGQLVRLVDDLLEVGRISQGKLALKTERVDVASIIQQAIESCRPAVEAARHELTVCLPAEPITVVGDPLRLAQVVSNLLGNSCKYTEPGGQIRVAVLRDGREVVISVQDSGVGIPAEMLSSIFEMFHQLDQSLGRAQGGLGIGLSLARRLVEMHGGTVLAKSEGPGRGSEFVVRLPTVADADRRQPVATPSEPIIAARPRRILVVDDNEDAATSLSMLMKLSGHETHVEHDGLSAVSAAAEFRPDVVLLDIGLPGLNGYEAARRLREQPGGKQLLLVALTGWGDESDRRRSSEAGFNSHLVKPVDQASLARLLNGWHG